MFARLSEDQVVLRAAAAAGAAEIASLPRGTVAVLGAAAYRADATWVPVTLLDGRKGFVEKAVTWERLEEFALAQAQAELFDAPGLAGNLVRTLKRGAKFHVLETVEAQGQSWMRIRQPSGGEGFLSGRTRLRSSVPNEGAVGGFELEASAMRKGVFGGALLMVIAVVWFFAGKKAGVIFYYPPVLFLMGLFALVKGMAKGNLRGALPLGLKSPWALGVGAAILGFGAWLAIAQPWRPGPTVWFVNGLDVPVVATLGGETVRIGPGESVSREVSAGRQQLIARNEEGEVLEEVGAEVSRERFLVHDVLGAALIAVIDVEYSTLPSLARLTGGKEKEPDVAYFAGTSWISIEDVEYPFREAPEQVEMSGTKTIHQASMVVDGGWKTAVGYTFSSQGPEQALRLASIVALAQGGEEAFQIGMELALGVGPERLLRFAEEAIAKRPTWTETHRAYQSALQALGRQEEAQEKYRKAYEANPTSSQAAYLHARLLPPGAATPILEAALARSPDDPWLLRSFGWNLLHERKYPEALEAFERIARGDPRHATSIVEAHVQALVANGKTAEAQRRLHRAVEHSRRDLVALYARVWQLPDADASLPTPAALVDTLYGEDFEERAEVAARAYDADGFRVYRGKMADETARVRASITAAAADPEAAARLATDASEDAIRDLDDVARVVVVCELLRVGNDAAALRVHRTRPVNATETLRFESLRSPDKAILEGEHSLDLMAVLAVAASRRAPEGPERDRWLAEARAYDVFQTFVPR